MKHVVQFSNGAASAWVAWWVLQNHQKEDVILLNHDPGAEHPDSKRFQKDVNNYVDHPVTEVSHERTLWELIPEQKALPNLFIPWCTRILKLEQCEKFLKTLNEEFVLYNGFGADEWRRVQRATTRGKHRGRIVKSPLFEHKKDGAWAKKVIRNEWGICLPEPYKYLEHNNCIPCFKGGKGHFVKVARHYPEQFERACKTEETIGHTVFKDMTLRELKRRHINDNQLSLFDKQAGIPCMCGD